MSAPPVITPFPPIPPTNQLTTAPVPDAALAAATLASIQISPSTPQPSSLIGSPSKEVAPISQPEQPIVVPETAKLIEIKESEPLPEEVEGWLQKLDQEGDISFDKTITHDGDVLLSDIEAQIIKQKVILPMTQSGVQQGLTRKVTDSARWLAEWCLRLIKVMKDKVKYAPEEIKST